MLDVKIYFLERCKSARNIVQHIGGWLDISVGSLDVHISQHCTTLTTPSATSQVRMRNRYNLS